MKSVIISFLFVFSCILALTGCATQKCVEKPSEDCVCTLQYDPVCGCNNVTYSNACDAECHGISTFTPGPCEKTK